MTRKPDLLSDGWCLEDGEEYHQAAPGSFQIPELSVRNALQPGDYAKLIFAIAVADDKQPSYERMWVIVRERVATGYLGLLDNDPDSITENDRLWSGVELPFEPRHIIDVLRGDSASIALASGVVTRAWR